MPVLYLLAAAAVLFVVLTPKTALAYVAGNPTEVELRSIGGGFSLRADAAAAFVAMQEAADRDGIVLHVESAFRTYEQQAALRAAYEAGTGNLAAEPGYSNHQSGTAVDITVHGVNTSPEYLWLEQNAAGFGFKNTGATFSAQREFWHWEYTA